MAGTGTLSMADGFFDNRGIEEEMKDGMVGGGRGEGGGGREGKEGEGGR